MEAVKLFNQELSSLYEIKPPISKAKMTAITKGAIRAIKYYKHVVQSVEKFIQKCRSEYKIPGLYVIDSIVRQSRHQFGAVKDVFAPRFAKNIQVTFYHLYKCPEEEKSKVIRVLNLWQKNEVFTADVIQPLFDLANPNSELHRAVENQIKSGGASAGSAGDKSTKAGSIQVVNTNQANDTELDASDAQILSTIQQFLRNHVPSNNSEVKFNRKLLDFDYSDDEDGGNQGNNNDFSEPTPQMLDALSNILNNERLLSKLKAMGEITQHHIQQLQQLLPHAQAQYSSNNMMAAAASSYHHQSSFDSVNNSSLAWMMASNNAGLGQPMMNDNVEMEDDIQIVDDRGSNRRQRSRSRSRDRKRSSRSHRSRSRSRERSSRRRRSRSREDREKKREREKKGLPPMKKGYLSVCSTTLWVGHLSKLVADEDLSDLFGEYGVVESINLIPPRGCAFVHMNRRMDAYKALKELHKHKLHGKPITIAWAPGKGMKDKQWKDYWDVNLGVSYIPLEKLDPQTDLVSLEDGGAFDDETIPDWMRNLRSNTSLTSQQPPINEATALGLPLQAAQLDPTLAAMGLPPGPPPGVPPFGLPPGIPPPVGAGLLGPPSGAPVIMPQPNLLLPPRFGHPPPHGFQPFDASQPPPGMRMPFPPPNVVPNVEGQGDIEMEIEDQDEPKDHGSDRRGPGNNGRGSRWGQGNKDSNEDVIQSRLRNLAGDSGDNNPRSLLDAPPWEAAPDRDGHRRPPPFGQRGGHQGPPPFEGGAGGGPPRFGDFNNGPPFRGGRQGPGNDGPPFNDNFQFRGGRGGWRGGRGGRGGFRDSGPGGPMWRDDNGPMGGPPGGGPPGGPPSGGPPGFGGNDRDQGWNEPPWNRGGRGGFGGRGGRGGGFENNRFGDQRPPFRDRDMDRDRDRDRDRESRERSRDRESRPAKRERRSRWGDQNDSEPSQPPSEEVSQSGPPEAMQAPPGEMQERPEAAECQETNDSHEIQEIASNQRTVRLQEPQEVQWVEEGQSRMQEDLPNAEPQDSEPRNSEPQEPEIQHLNEQEPFAEAPKEPEIQRFQEPEILHLQEQEPAQEPEIQHLQEQEPPQEPEIQQFQEPPQEPEIQHYTEQEPPHEPEIQHYKEQEPPQEQETQREEYQEPPLVQDFSREPQEEQQSAPFVEEPHQEVQEVATPIIDTMPQEPAAVEEFKNGHHDIQEDFEPAQESIVSADNNKVPASNFQEASVEEAEVVTE